MAPEPRIVETPQREGLPAVKWETRCCTRLPFRMVRTPWRAQVRLAAHLRSEHDVTIAPDRLLVHRAHGCHCRLGVSWLSGEPCADCDGYGFRVSPAEPMGAPKDAG